MVFAQPLIIAHRGAMGYAPENTLAAFSLALEKGSDAIELDLRMTRDGVPVVLHDASINRTTNSKGDIFELSYAEIRNLDAGSWFDPKYKDERIPTLQEVIDLLNDTVLIIIELKEGNDIYPGIEEKVIDIIRQNGISKQVFLKSFDPNTLKRLREIDPEITLVYVYALRIPWLGLIIDRGISFGSIFDIEADYLQPHRFFLSRSFVKEAQSRGFKIISWGVNSEEAILNSIDYGVDGIETDYPDKIRKMLNLPYFN